MNFQLLAIRPLKNCSKKYRKILKAGEVYRFYNNYEFNYDDYAKPIEESVITNIVITSENKVNLYNVENGKGNPINIRLSAIVGKNGSGKSTLPELLLYSLFRMLNYLGKINKQEERGEGLKMEEFDYIKNFNNCIDDIERNLKIELYYLIDDTINIIKIENDVSKKIIFNEQGEYNIQSAEWQNIKDSQFSFDNFFYTVLMNYSLHSFNSNEIDNWVNAFFHKNDGYQMPIVINPYREKGSIDINTERVLTRDRLLANILLIESYNINQKSKISKVSLHTNGSKFNKYLYIKENINNRVIQVDRFTEEFKDIFRDKVLIPLYKVMFKGAFEYPVSSISDNIYSLCENYLIFKIINVFRSYDSFNEFNFQKAEVEIQDNFEFDKLSPEIVDKIIEAIIDDKSHITLKIRQTFNFIRKNIYTDYSIDVYNKVEVEIGVIDNQLKVLIEEIKDEEWFTEIIDYLPPPIFFSRLHFSNDGGTYEDLSSGEKQQIKSLNSIIYHLRNLDSVHKKGEIANRTKGIIPYYNINLILDEIELYYHPEFQRNTIKELLFLIKEAKFEFIKNINICLITHSPFILSDIPNTNILGLKDGMPDPFLPSKKTFGANIHDLLANDFFLENGFMGEFAKQKINQVIDSLKRTFLENSLKNELAKEVVDKSKTQKLENELSELTKSVLSKSECIGIIEYVGEPILQNSLFELYADAYPEDRKTYFKKQIDFLTKLMEEQK